MDRKTHTEAVRPEISVRHLADYMAGSERKRRSIVADCKYRPVARLLQHKEAVATVTSSLLGGPLKPDELRERSEAIRSKLATDDFDALTNEANAEYVLRFSDIANGLELPAGAELTPGEPHVHEINGVGVRFRPTLMLRRRTRTNKLHRGALMLRYAKGKPLKPEVGGYQSAAIFGLLCETRETDQAEPAKPLCLTLDVLTGVLHPAPGSSVSIFHNMKAACESIAERWPAIRPPDGAVI